MQQKRRVLELICTLFTGQSSKEGIFMRYSYEFKRKCVEMYNQGMWPNTPDGIKTKSFHDKIRIWARIENANGPEALKHKKFNKEWSAEERYALVVRILDGESYTAVAVDAGITISMIRRWVSKYNEMGYNGLNNCKKGRPSKNPDMKKINYNNPRKLNESEYEELIRLRAENEYIKTEIEVIKKEIALREEKQAARLKAKKQQSLKNCAKKDTN